VAEAQVPLGIDTSVAHPARVYDYLLGGDQNFPVDREVASRNAAAFGGLEASRAVTRANRAFLGRAVRYLVAEAGIRQFLDIGTGLPSKDHVHTVAQREAADTRVVYVDNDPLVLTHAETLLASTPQGTAQFIIGDLREPADILLRAAATLDFEAPVAVVLSAVLHLIHDDEDPYGIVASLLAAVPSGSYLVVAHLATDLEPERSASIVREQHRQRDQATFTFAARSRDEIARFARGLDVIEPGVVPVTHWRPDRPPALTGILYGLVARKP
jgi:hypothetical protein